MPSAAKAVLSRIIQLPFCFVGAWLSVPDHAASASARENDKTNSCRLHKTDLCDEMERHKPKSDFQIAKVEFNDMLAESGRLRAAQMLA